MPTLSIMEHVFTLKEVLVFMLLAFLGGYGYAYGGSDHEYLRYIENENKNKDQIP